MCLPTPRNSLRLTRARKFFHCCYHLNQSSIKTTLWRNDLHYENIHMNPEKWTETVAMIDWQSMDARRSWATKTPDIGNNLSAPVLDTKDINQAERKLVSKRYHDRAIMVAWRMMVKGKILTTEEVAEIEKDVECDDEGIKVLNITKEKLEDRWPEKGIIEHANYEALMTELKEVKVHIMWRYLKCDEDIEAFEKRWPFHC
ncbi:hypothetical protein PAAG_00040 [Paracoccidioides lutzii Pb01]|uniref:Aminoglycoside phosphotransferase domain-containing protein n=1 Tax=Paracoccidioides lutzii (strain ATCC MYA-826 / Pb01) TaxID=502779 RepID=C1GNE5_PARBA|nr:hypothetical protein PAAG_00040 [Paracoccidioides lutzii Pb01]EEH35717.2 hypothetical protein PAAG_00040 [Paracoccidioides lutzii Pb01]